MRRRDKPAIEADVLYRNCRVLTLSDAGGGGDPTQGRARSLAVLGDRVAAVAKVPARRHVDLRGATVVPGFHDAHCHTIGFGLAASHVPLATPPVGSLDELYRAVAERAAVTPPGSWVIGSGYDQTKLGFAHPHVDALDRVAGDHRVWLLHFSGHMCVVNSRVLADIDPQGHFGDTPEGGRVVHDDSGRPTGLLLEQAQSMVTNLLPPLDRATMTDAIGRAHDQYLREGVTSCQEAGVAGGLAGYGPQELAAYQDARAQGRLRVRTTLMVSSDYLLPRDGDGNPGSPHLDLRSGFGDNWLRIGPVKVFADGSLLGRTALMREGFSNDPGNRGALQMSEDSLRATIRAAHDAGWQVATHAIGDRAIDVVLDTYEAMLADSPRPDHRHRIEHCAVADPAQVARIAALGVIPTPQGHFVGELGDAMAAALGPDRISWCYRQRSFLDAGVVLAGSSDRPVVPGAPLLGIHDMVNRLTGSGGDFVPDERVTARQALEAYTYGSAYAAFTEADRGRLVPGALADFAVLSDDPTTCPPDRIKDIEVLATVVGGRFAYDGAGFGDGG